MTFPEKKESKHATVRLPKTMLSAIEEFLKTEEAKKQGFLYITDVVTEAVREYLTSRRFEFINHDEKGVKIHDRQLHRVADVYIRPEGVWCDLCKTKQCEHITFALTHKEMQPYLKKKREEGWNLPEPE
jgi:hypothetical protein